MEFGIDASRVQKLNQLQVRKGAKYVLYWMQAAIRSHFNPALEYAINRANTLDLPLLCTFGLYEKYPEANERHFAFLLQGLVDAGQQLEARGIQLVILHRSPPDIVKALSLDAAMVVTDRGYLRLLRQWRTSIADSVTCSMIQVEGEVVVPIEVASNKEETAARTIRPKITKLLGRYMISMDEMKPVHPSVDLALDDIFASHDLKLLDWKSKTADQLLESLDVDRQVPQVKWILGGNTEAKKWLQLFVEKKLPKYATDRNEPSSDVFSNMSPYLHFGHISPVYIALQVHPLRHKFKESVDSFLEEMIVRRELAINFCYYNENYDSYQSIPNFARITLDDHRNDKRERMYTYEQLEAGVTHDEYWNACQLEMVARGKMNGYMRMYWAKKILEWTPSPEVAYQYCLDLNNKYEMDGRDPNGYTGVSWSFGKHDQGWAERPIFGKVRYMNDQGLKRKFNMEAYIRKVDQYLKDCKLPAHVQSVLDKQAKTKRQSVITVTPPAKKVKK